MEPLLAALLLSIGFQIVMFVPAFLFRTDKLTDLSYGLTFIFVAAVSFWLGIMGGHSLSTGKLILLFMVSAWAIRLASYLFIRIQKTGKDERFDKMRSDLKAFLGFWLLQGLTVWAVMIPSIMYLSSADVPLGIATIIGVIIWLAGLIIEGVADMQKFNFRNNPKNKGKWIESGLWRYSRHPNYFGEILCWVGVFIFTLTIEPFRIVAGLVSPLFISGMLIFVSGIPLLEKKDDERFGKSKDYHEYKRKTSVLFLLPRKR